MTERFRVVAERIVANVASLARALQSLGYRIVSGGTKNHIVLVDFRGAELTGLVAEKALEECHIIVNKNAIPGDTRSVHVTSGVRLGTNTLAYRGLGPDEMMQCAQLMDRVLRAVRVVDERTYELDREVRDAIRRDVQALSARFPIPGDQG